MFLQVINIFLLTPLLATSVHLGLGETYKVPTQPLQSLRIEKKGILQIKDEGSQLLFIAKKLGKTEVQVGQKKYHFVVLHKYKKQTWEQLKDWVQGKRGPQIEIVNNLPEIKGRLLRVNDFIDLATYTDEKSTFRVSASLNSKMNSTLSDYLKQLLKHNNLASGRLTTHPQWRYDLSKSEKNNLPIYKKILSPYGIEARIDPNAFAQTPVIEIKVFIAHVKKSFIRQWGLQWPSEVQAQVIPGGALSWQSLNFSLRALEDQGQGQLLATPSLVTESDKLAEFHSGGEIPIRTTTQFNNNIEWKRFGLFLKTKAKVNSQGNVKVEIDLEMSSLDQDSSSTDIPALTRSQVKTQVHMNSPRPILLSGFSQNQSGESTAGLPWLSQIPILKPLFSNGQIYNRDYELIFILYPKILGHDVTE